MKPSLISFTLAALAVGGSVWAGQEPILLEHPAVWYAFDNDTDVRTSSGAANLTISSNSSGWSFVSNAPALGGAIRCGDEVGPWGSGLPFGTGSWTLVTRLKTSEVANRILWGAGSIVEGKHGLVMQTAGGNDVTFCVRTNFATVESSLTITVPEATTAYHDYACAFDLETRLVHVFVDGVEKGTLAFDAYNSSNTNWQWFGMNGGMGESGLSAGTDCVLDDFRFYQRQLVAEELGALLRGRTPVPVAGGFVTATAALVWPNTQLKDIVRVRARPGGSSINKDWAVPFYQTHTAEALDVQMQGPTDGRYNKVMWLALAQDGDNVTAQLKKVGYLETSGYGVAGVNGTVGNDFSINWVSDNNIAIGNAAGGYGLHQLTADTLYDENAAIWSAGTAPAAGQNASFVTGGGTVENTSPAGTAFGRLAFGIASESWTITGAAGRFADVVNASTAAQTIDMPLAYADDFRPETLGDLSFRNLAVGGTFAPVGTGAITLVGDSQLGVASLVSNVRSVPYPADYPTGSWANQNAGYMEAQVQQTHSLRTAPGGHTTIGRLQTNLAGQRRQATILDGDFTIGGALELGHDSIFAVKNGTVEFQTGYTPGTLGINAFLFVHDGARLVLPTLAATTGQYVCLDGGTLDAGAVTTTSTLTFRKNGTLNTDVLSGTVSLDGVTVGPKARALAVTAALTFATGDATTPGVTFRTSLPDGTPSVVTLAGALTQNAEVPLAVIGGGRLAVSRAAALTLPEAFTLGDGTTADFSACASVAFENAVALGAGSRLVLPDGWTGAALPFAQKPQLPEEGVATICLAPSASLVPGAYALAAEGFTADDLAHLALTFTGASACDYAATLAVDDAGALTATVVRASAAGARQATITFTGYAGTTTLENFPALVQLPAGVPGFSYADAAANGADVYFTDADGNRIPHEIDTWNTEGSSYLWVRVPRLSGKTTQVSLHWGGGTANMPALAAGENTFDSDYLGVWHFSSLGTTTPDSSANALTLTVNGTAANIQLAESPIGTGVQQTASGVNLQTPNSSKWLAYAQTKQLSVSGWFKITSKTSNMRLVSAKSDWTSAAGFELTTRDAAATAFLVGGANKTQRVKTGLVNHYDNWVYYTALYDGTKATPEMRLFMNGVQVDTATGADWAVAAATSSLALGSMADKPSSNTYLGYQDEVRLSKVVRSDDWIAASYQTMKAPLSFATGGAAFVDGLPYDFRALTTPNTVTEDTGANLVFAGVDTTLTVPGEGLLTIEAGKKATIPGWKGALVNGGYLKYTGVSSVTEAPRAGTTEYAGEHVLAFSDASTPLVLSGNVTVVGEYAILQYQNAPVTVTGGTTTFSGIIRIGERNSDVGYGTNYGGILNVAGGAVVSDGSGTLDCSGYTTRPMTINVMGGTFAVPFRAWYTAGATGLSNCTVNVGATGVFAPPAFAMRNAGTPPDIRVFITGRETGTFLAPSVVPAWAGFTAAAGTPRLTSAPGAEVEYAGPIEIAAGASLVVAGEAGAKPYLVFANTVSGAGELVVEQAILDFTEAPDFTGFTGGVRVRDGGVLILPSDAVPAFPITLEDGARIIATVADTPDQTAAFLGAVAATPATGTATIEFDLPVSLPQGSVYKLSTSQLPAGAASSLAVVFTGAAGESTAGTIALDDAGAVEVTVTESLNKGTPLVWAGSGSDVVTPGDGVLAWLPQNDLTGAKMAFVPNVPLWFTDFASLKTVTIEEEVKAGTANFAADDDYTLRGAGALDAPAVVKTGAGTLTLQGTGFKAPASVNVQEGTLKLGEAAVRNVLGTENTVVTIASGATLDLNTQLPESANTQRGAVTYDQEIVIAGDGVDGLGAIVDSNVNNAWEFQLGRVRLAADASIGGTARIDFRGPAGAAYTGRRKLTGEGKTFTSRVVVPEDWNMGLNFNAADIDVGKFVVAEGASAGFEGDTTVTAAEGIELKDGARIQYWSSTGRKAPIRVTGTAARLKASSSACTQDAAVTVEPDASVEIYGNTTFNLSGAFTNAGSVTVSGATPNFVGASFKNLEGSTLAVTGGEAMIDPTAAEGVLTLAQSGGTAHVGSKADWTDVAISLTLTNGTFWWGTGAAEGFPTIGENTLTTDITGGRVTFHTGRSDTIPAAFSGMKPAEVCVYNGAGDQVTTFPAGTYESSSLLSVGAANYPGHLNLAPGAHVTAANLRLADLQASPKKSVLEVGPESTLTVTAQTRVGHWSGATTERHELNVTGGTYESLADSTCIGWDSPYAFMTLSAGEANVKGLKVRIGTSAGALAGDERFTQTGGTLSVGANGFDSARNRRDGAQIDLKAGTYRATANHAVAKYGMIVETGSALADAGSALTIDTAGFTIDQSKSVHGGASDVTVTGGGQFKTSSDFQNVARGKWAVTGETAADLTGFSGFAGGLDVAAGSSAELGVSNEGAVEYAYLAMGFDDAIAYAATGTFTCVSSHLRKMHTQYASGAPANQCSFAVRGQFYVPETDAGTWTFAGNYDDNLCLVLDGTPVFSNKTWNAVAYKQLDVSVGWHDFAYIVNDGTGGQGPCQGNWANKKSLGWAVGALTSTEANDYAIFDTSTLKMRVKPTPACEGVAWQRLAGTGYGSYDPLKNIEASAFPAGTVEASLKNILNTKIATTQQGSAQRYVGNFVVPQADAGEWTFEVAWDDCCIVTIDGAEVVHNTAWDQLGTGTVTLNAGIHAFEIRTADGSGGYGPDPKSNHSGYGVAVKRPGDTVIQPFDERTLLFPATALTAQLAAATGLGGISTVDGTLANGGLWTDLTGRWCPIYGTLAGCGTLTGPFRFTGDAATWQVGVDRRKVTSSVTFANADSATLAGLKKISLACSERPTVSRYVLGDALGLTDAAAADITVLAPIPDELRKASDSGDNFPFHATVQEGKLVVVNENPVLPTMILLR